MKKLGLIITFIFLWGCANQTTSIKPQVQKEKIEKLTPEQIYKNYPVNISLNHCKKKRLVPYICLDGLKQIILYRRM